MPIDLARNSRHTRSIFANRSYHPVVRYQQRGSDFRSLRDASFREYYYSRYRARSMARDRENERGLGSLNEDERNRERQTLVIIRVSVARRKARLLIHADLPRADGATARAHARERRARRSLLVEKQRRGPARSARPRE